MFVPPFANDILTDDSLTAGQNRSFQLSLRAVNWRRGNLNWIKTELPRVIGAVFVYKDICRRMRSSSTVCRVRRLRRTKTFPSNAVFRKADQLTRRDDHWSSVTLPVYAVYMQSRWTICRVRRLRRTETLPSNAVYREADHLLRWLGQFLHLSAYIFEKPLTFTLRQSVI